MLVPSGSPVAIVHNLMVQGQPTQFSKEETSTSTEMVVLNFSSRKPSYLPRPTVLSASSSISFPGSAPEVVMRRIGIVAAPSRKRFQRGTAETECGRKRSLCRQKGVNVFFGRIEGRTRFSLHAHAPPRKPPLSRGTGLARRRRARRLVW